MNTGGLSPVHLEQEYFNRHESVCWIIGNSGTHTKPVRVDEDIAALVPHSSLTVPGKRTANSTPTITPAPLRFSAMTCCLSAGPIVCAMTREVMSTPPPRVESLHPFSVYTGSSTTTGISRPAFCWYSLYRGCSATIIEHLGRLANLRLSFSPSKYPCEQCSNMTKRPTNAERLCVALNAMAIRTSIAGGTAPKDNLVSRLLRETEKARR